MDDIVAALKSLEENYWNMYILSWEAQEPIDIQHHLKASSSMCRTLRKAIEKGMLNELVELVSLQARYKEMAHELKKIQGRESELEQMLYSEDE